MWSAFRNWLQMRRRPSPAVELLDWARRQSLEARPLRQGEGWGLSGALEGCTMRLDWGPGQGVDLLGPALRLRLEAGLPPRLQMLLLSRRLAERLEREAYTRLTAVQQTRLDPGLSEAMRWLAMYPPLLLPAMRPLRERFRAVAPAAWTMQAWLDAELIQALADSRRWLPDDRALQLLTLRGRVELRVETAEPSQELLAGAAALALLAMRQARAVALRSRDPVQAPPTRPGPG